MFIRLDVNTLLNEESIKEAKYNPPTENAGPQLIITTRDLHSRTVSGADAEDAWLEMQQLRPQPMKTYEPRITRPNPKPKKEATDGK